MRKRQSPLVNLGGKKAAIYRYSLRLVVALHELYRLLATSIGSTVLAGSRPRQPKCSQNLWAPGAWAIIVKHERKLRPIAASTSIPCGFGEMH